MVSHTETEVMHFEKNIGICVLLVKVVSAGLFTVKLLFSLVTNTLEELLCESA